MDPIKPRPQFDGAEPMPKPSVPHTVQSQVSPVHPVLDQMNPAKPKAHPNEWRQWLIALLLVLIVLIGVGIAYYYTQYRNNNQTSTTTSPTPPPVSKEPDTTIDQDTQGADTSLSQLDADMASVDQALGDQSGSLAE